MRIFCPGRELPFAGHPTLGSCHAWLRAGGQPRGAQVVQECGVGLVRIRRESDRLAFAAPPLRRAGPLEDAELARITQGLGLAPEDIVAHAWCDNGPHWRAIYLDTLRQLLALRPDEPRALFFLGLDAMRRADRETARGHWQRLLAGLPADAPLAREIRRRLEDPAATR